MWDNSWNMDEAITEFIETLDGAYRQYALDYLHWHLVSGTDYPDDAALDKSRAAEIRVTITNILNANAHGWLGYLPESTD